MEKQEWQAYVQKVATCDYPIPTHLINDYNDWKCRSNVGRMLMILKDIEGAMSVLATVKDVQPNMEDAPEYGLSEAEHKVLCLRDIAEIVWQLTGTGDAPIFYLREADKICREYKYVFRSAKRGEIWVHQLEIMRRCGENQKALLEATAMLEEQKEHLGVNPYRFYALKFIAEDLAEKGDYIKASLLLADAYKSFPVNAAAENDLQKAAVIVEPKERYEAYHHCTTIQYQPWERDNVMTLEDVHRLQEENFKKREAAKVAQKQDGVQDLISQLK